MTITMRRAPRGAFFCSAGKKIRSFSTARESASRVARVAMSAAMVFAGDRLSIAEIDPAAARKRRLVALWRTIREIA